MVSSCDSAERGLTELDQTRSTAATTSIDSMCSADGSASMSSIHILEPIGRSYISSGLFVNVAATHQCMKISRSLRQVGQIRHGQVPQDGDPDIARQRVRFHGIAMCAVLEIRHCAMSERWIHSVAEVPRDV